MIRIPPPGSPASLVPFSCCGSRSSADLTNVAIAPPGGGGFCGRCVDSRMGGGRSMATTRPLVAALGFEYQPDAALDRDRAGWLLTSFRSFKFWSGGGKAATCRTPLTGFQLQSWDGDQWAGVARGGRITPMAALWTSLSSRHSSQVTGSACSFTRGCRQPGGGSTNWRCMALRMGCQVVERVPRRSGRQLPGPWIRSRWSSTRQFRQ